jgi:phosphonate transport system substrate-binding protein
MKRALLLRNHLMYVLSISLLLLTGCKTSTIAPTATPLPTLTPAPTQAPTNEPIGSISNPIVLGLVGNPTNSGLMEAADFLANYLNQGVDEEIYYKIVPNFRILVNEMAKKSIHIAFLPPATYLYANELGFAEAHLLTENYGMYFYGTQFFIHAKSGLFPYFDEETQENIDEPVIALTQLQGKRPCWVSPFSVSGYLIPSAILQQNGIQTQTPIFTYGSSALIRALYITGICDFGATFALLGDPRTSESVISDLTDVNERIKILWQSDPIIPTYNISTHPVLSERTVETIMTSFLVLAQTDEGKQWLLLATGENIENLMIIDDSYYQDMRSILDGLDYDLEQFIGN